MDGQALAALREKLTDRRQPPVEVSQRTPNPPTRIRSSRGKRSVTDGPFAETQEVVGGYALIPTWAPPSPK